MDEQDKCSDESLRDSAATTADGDTEESQDGECCELNRLGEVEKCPVCGSHVDAEAYQCPSCRNYFCFHCRSRLVPPDRQLKCVNQQCAYYGKLICDVCDGAREREESPTVYAEPEDGYWPGWLAIALIAFACVLYYGSLVSAALTAVGIFVLGGGLLQVAGVNIFGKNRIVELPRTSTYHSCVRCGEIVKEIKRPQ